MHTLHILPPHFFFVRYTHVQSTHLPPLTLLLVCLGRAIEGCGLVALLASDMRQNIQRRLDNGQTTLRIAPR